MSRTFLNLNPPDSAGKTTILTGVRQHPAIRGLYYVSGFQLNAPGTPFNIISYVYKGGLTDQERADPANWHVFAFPSGIGRTVTSTSAYGIDLLKCGEIRLVGSYTTSELTQARPTSFVYSGPLDGSGKWETLEPHFGREFAVASIAHAVAKDVVVGDCKLTAGGDSVAFVYDLVNKRFTKINIFGAVGGDTAYGVQWDCHDRYVVCGSVGNAAGPRGFLVDYDRCIDEFTHLRTYVYPDATITTFTGVSRDSNGGYNVTGEAVLPVGTEVVEVAFLANVSRTERCRFSRDIVYNTLVFPDATITTANSITGDTVVGIAEVAGAETGYISPLL